MHAFATNDNHVFSDQEQFRHDVRKYASAGLLLAQMPGDDELEQALQRRLETISQLLNNILAMVPAGQQQQELRTWPVDMGDLVEECAQIIRLTKRANVVEDLAQKAIGYGDPLMLRRAVTNVLDNASRAAGPDGTIRVRTHQEDGHACLEVVDDGAGFGQIPFNHGHGMLVVDQALRACGGRLEIFSGPGPGTTVRMLVPAYSDGRRP
ncbi:MAG TPA: HAMP domain-containing sensor histidine kinase [Nocardioidaceae bacterium]|nr:HAMP domain-containing sensor histidine kinase [Nocardioidaceae bacterium]